MRGKIKCGENLRKAKDEMENKTTVSILRMRRKIQEFCQWHGRGLQIGIKLIVSFLLFLVINHVYGKTGMSYMVLAGVFAVICAAIPLRFVYLLSIMLTTFHLFQVSWDLVLFYLAAVLLSYLMVCRMEPDAAIIIAFTPVFFYMKLPLLLPVLIGMFSNLFGVAAMAFGIFFYFFSSYVKDVAILLSSATGGENIIAVKNIMDSFTGDAKALLLLCSFLVAAVLTWILYHQSFDYAWYTGIVLGALSGFLVYLGGGFFFDIQSVKIGSVLSSLAAVLAATVIQFFRCIIDYGSAEYIEFEDDEYYYYVKAVPKVTTIGEDFSSAAITAQKRSFDRFGKKDKS